MTIALVVSGETIGEYSFNDVALEDDDITTIADAQLLARVARHRDEPEDQYDGYVVDRFRGDGAEENFVIRKRAVYEQYGFKECPECGYQYVQPMMSVDDDNYLIVVYKCWQCGYRWEE